MTDQPTGGPRAPVVGWTCFATSATAVFLAVLVALYIPVTAYLDVAATLTGLVLGVVSLIRRERPIAFAVVGLVLSALIAALMVYAILS
jgi:hypothetical protein